MARFEETVNIRPQSMQTGEFAQKMSLAQQLDAFDNEMLNIASQAAAQRGQQRAGEVVIEKDAQGLSKPPKFDKVGILGRTEAQAHNKALMSAYVASLDSDIKAGIANLQLKNPDDISKFNDAADAYRKAVITNVDPLIRQKANIVLSDQIGTAAIAVQQADYKKQKKEAYQTLLVSEKQLFDNALLSGRDGDVTKSAQSIIEYNQNIDAQVETGFLDLSEAVEKKRQIQLKASNQNIIGEFKKKTDKGDLWQIQSNLNRGELDPLLVGRVDLAAYYNGVQTAKNVLSIPQGGMKKRPGTRFLGAALGDGRLERFSFNVEQNYLLVFTALKMQIYKDGVLQTNINGSGDDWLDIPWTLAQIQEFDYIQSADTIIITHEDVETRVISRTSDTAWSIAAAGFSNIPMYDFNDGSSPTPTSEIQSINFAAQTEGDVFRLTLDQILTENITFTNNDATNNAAIAAALQRLPNTGATGISVTATAALDTYQVTFADSSAYPYGLMAVTPVSTKDAAFTAAVTRSQTGVARQEDTWSATRGWPRTCTFHEGRLWLGGSKSRPNTIWGSRVAEFFNFDKGQSFDAESVEATLDTDQVNAIESIFSNRSLQIFTSGGEFYVPASPITPENIAVKLQTNLGSKRVRPVTVDGVTLFIQRTGKAVVQFVFMDEFQANQARSISFMASHLIKNPVKQAVRRGTSGEDANYILFNNDDGTVTVFNTLSSEGVAGFTRIETAADSTSDGLIKSIAVVDDEINYLVKRTINSSTVYYVEIEDTSVNTDSAIVGTGLASDTLTGLSHLEGEEVEVKADGAVMLNQTVSSGEITTERTADTIEAGLAFRPEIVTMPLNVQLQNGPNASSKKKIGRVSVHLYESNGVVINGHNLADKTIGQDQFDAPTPQTGIKRIHVLGWSLDAQVTITQSTPMPMTILNIGTEVKT